VWRLGCGVWGALKSRTVDSEGRIIGVASGKSITSILPRHESEHRGKSFPYSLNVLETAFSITDANIAAGVGKLDNMVKQRNGGRPGEMMSRLSTVGGTF